ncbi:MAG: glycosyltransferase [Halomonas sp.]|uniref:glycosyltransferase n=1 Tax=Halomonas sp. TaxID=1486246 RepID=UPI0017BDB02E|nr:glycosyltransferase [Halomonas sp.]NWN83353.1 glycosyltransferase [Halomonas sp.]
MDVILHIGAGQGEQLEAWLAEGVRRVVLFEPHPELAERLASANKQRLNVSVAAVAIAAEEGGCSLQEYNLPEANSLRAPTDLKSLFPGLKRTNRYPVQAITPHRMMAEYGPADEEAARLVIEAPGEAYAMLQPLMESDELGRFSELQISMTVVPRYQGSVTAEQTLRALRDYGYDVVCHDDHDPDWPTWTLHRNPLKVALKQQQQALDQAEREKAKSHQECDALNQQVAELRQARASEQAKACQERDALNRQVEERQAKWKQLDQQHKKLQKELEALTVKLERKHRHFMSRKTQALKGEETIKKLQGERKTLVTAKASLQEALDTLRADHQTLEQVRADLQQKLAEKDIRLTEREAALNDYRQRYTQGLLAPVRDVSQVDFTTARRWYQREGILTDTLRALDSLRLRGERFDDAQQAFQARLEGLLRLNHVPLPPRADHPAVTSVPYQVLYCLHQSASQASNGYTQRAHAIATGLRQVGFDVVATTRPGFPWEAGASDSNSPHHTAEVEGITYVAARGTRRANTTLVHYLEEAAQHFAQQARACKAELIVAASNHMTALPALMAARRLGLPFVYEVRGLWEATRAAAQPAWADSEHYRLMRQLEQQTAREAQGVIALSDELADELAGWGVARERIAVVPQGGHTRHVQPMDADADTRAALNLAPGVPVIGYAGSATDHSGLVLQLQALARLKQQGQAFVFVLVGDGNGVDRARATARELGIEAACRFTGRVPHEQLPRYLACLDILVVPRPAAPLTEVAAEIKPLEAMAMGKALVLSDDTPHLALAGAQDQRARRFPRDNAQALSEALQDLIASPDQRQRLGQAARRWVEQERSVRQLALTFAAALEHARPTQPQRPATSEAQSPTTTALLDLAWRLASRQESPIAPVAGRVAYVVSHGQSYASNGYAVRTQGVAQALNQHGLDTLCFVRPGRPWELGVGQDDIAAEVEVDGVRYLHTPWPSSKAPHGDLERILAMAASLLEQFRTYRPAAVLAGSNWIVGLSAWIAAKRLGLPFYNEVRGFWELSREAREPGYAETPAFPQEADLDTFVAQQADKVFTLNVPMQQELARRGIDAGRIERVPNGVSQLPTLKPASLALKRKLGIAEGERVVGYVGSFSAYEGLDLLLDACTELVQSGEKLKLLLVGDSQPVTQASQRLTNLADAPWLIQVGRVPHEHVADYYALLDAVVIPRKPLAVCQLVPPMKAAEALAYGKRLVVSDVAPLAEYAEKFDGVVSF